MSSSSSPPSRAYESVLGATFFLVALAASIWFTHQGWDKPLLDTHPFRQTQTALSAYWMMQDGVRLDYATPVLGAPWSIPMEFPVYQFAVVKVVKASSMSLDSAGRLVSLSFFYLALPAIWLLLRRLGINAMQRWLFLALVLLSPVYVFYSRTFLIESTAFCLAVWFLYFFHAALQQNRWGALSAALFFGIMAGLAKVTTYAVFLAPAAAFTLHAAFVRRVSWRPLLGRAGIAAVPGIIAAAWWVAHSDAVKRQNVLGVSLTSTAQREWNYGPFALRFTPDFWQQFGMQLERGIIPLGGALVIGVVGLIFLRGRWRLFISMMAVALAGPLVFANLYFVHDYYLYSSGVLLLAALALPLKLLLERTELSLGVRLGVAVLVLGAQFAGYFKSYYKIQTTAEARPPELTQVLKRITQPTDVFVGFGMNWNSVIPYYSERRSMMVPDQFVRDDEVINEGLKNLGIARVAAVILFRLTEPGPAFFAPWLKKLGMDENPFIQTGEYTVHIRKDMLPEALKALGDFPLKDVLLYGGQLAKPGEKPPLIFYTDQITDRTAFSMIDPPPVKAMVPFGLGSEIIDGRRGFMAHTPTEVEVVTPPGARTISVEFGINPGAYESSDGVEFEIVLVRPSGARQRLYQRLLQPSVLKGDRGVQSVELEPTASIEGSLLFRTLPAGSPNFDWAYWSKISVR